MNATEMWNSFTKEQQEAVAGLATYADTKGLIKGVLLGGGLVITGLLVDPVVTRIQRSIADRKSRKENKPE